MAKYSKFPAHMNKIHIFTRICMCNMSYYFINSSLFAIFEIRTKGRTLLEYTKLIAAALRSLFDISLKCQKHPEYKRSRNNIIYKN